MVTLVQAENIVSNYLNGMMPVEVAVNRDATVAFTEGFYFKFQTTVGTKRLPLHGLFPLMVDCRTGRIHEPKRSGSVEELIAWFRDQIRPEE
ncbi:hypothetical protein [Flavilitoribacter nigricans]|uniref:Uncharacterized protein n=1 Tax=Flavilitoribacter nigricans (strain ATCC 23147 / DSM 23189 / NBRC 102662 / NCIMB 1420 / SS-2) TaxID=1122177 RepID=A0A2D0NDF5_FLAN2|nr:hypothetical protein [Flavilitoribacter nigricans]PHN06438.1 hypothetical protein CRP01_12785 [Flavilitoribacter nigricans DSM 23189 = NBRC 102662]